MAGTSGRPNACGGSASSTTRSAASPSGLRRAAMRVLVTGGAGFIGSHLWEVFLGKDWGVGCMDDFVTGAPDNLVGGASRGGFPPLEAGVDGYIRPDGQLDWGLHFATPASP